MTGELTHTISKKEMVPHTPVINYHLKSEVSIMLRCQLCSSITNLKSTSTIKEATMKNMDNFRYKGKSSRATTKSIPFAVSKDEWGHKGGHCMVSP